MKSYADIHSIDPDTLRAEYGETILATYLVGSRAYGTATSESDEDYRGIFILPRTAYLSIREPVNQVSDERNNTTYYTLKRFLELAASANPNIIEMLFMPSDCRVFEAPLMRRTPRTAIYFRHETGVHLACQLRRRPDQARQGAKHTANGIMTLKT